MPHHAANSVLADIRNGDHAYSEICVVQCKTCRSKYRAEIERGLIDGLSPRMIVDRLPDDHDVSWQSIGRHYRRHLPVDSEMVQRRQEIRGEERWADLGRAATGLWVERADVAQHVVEQCTQRILDGSLTMSAATLMRAVQFLRDIEVAALQKESDKLRADRLVAQSILEMRHVFEIAGDIGGDHFKHAMIRRACVDTATELIMVDDRFADLREAAYLQTEMSGERQGANLSPPLRSGFGHPTQVDESVRAAA